MVVEVLASVRTNAIFRCVFDLVFRAQRVTFVGALLLCLRPILALGAADAFNSCFLGVGFLRIAAKCPRLLFVFERRVTGPLQVGPEALLFLRVGQRVISPRGSTNVRQEVVIGGPSGIGHARFSSGRIIDVVRGKAFICHHFPFLGPPESGKVFLHRVRASARSRGPDHAIVIAVTEKPVGFGCIGDLIAGTQRVSFLGTSLLGLGPIQSRFLSWHRHPLWVCLGVPRAAAHSELHISIGGLGGFSIHTLGQSGPSGIDTAGGLLFDWPDASFGAPKFDEEFWKGCPRGIIDCLTEPAFAAGARLEVRTAHRREAAAVESDVLGNERASVLVVNVGWRNVCGWVNRRERKRKEKKGRERKRKEEKGRERKRWELVRVGGGEQRQQLNSDNS
jgi:hypothetical protein